MFNSLAVYSVFILVGLLSSVVQARAKFADKLNLMPTYYFDDIGDGTTPTALPVKDELDLSWHPVRNWKFHAAPSFFSDPVSKSSSEQAIFDVGEANVEVTRGNWQTKAGINSIAWGVTDVVNPLDVVSPRRYTDFLNIEKRGVPSLDLTWDNGTWRFEGLYVPVQFESILPGENSRWLPRDISYNRTIANVGELVASEPFGYGYVSSRSLDDALHNNVGFRIDRRGRGLDLTGVFFQGAPTAPAIFLTKIVGVIANPQGTGDILFVHHLTIQPVYYVRQTAGLGAVATLGSTIVRLELASSTPVSVLPGALPGWTESAVLGVEQGFAVGGSTLTMLSQISTASHEDQASDNSLTSLDRMFDRAAMVGLRYATSMDWAWTLAGLYDTEYQSGYAQAKVEHKIADGVTASLTGDWLDGDASTPLGTYRRNKRASLGINAFF